MPAGDRLLDVEALLAAFATPLPILGYSPARERRSRRQRAVGSSLEEMRASENSRKLKKNYWVVLRKCQVSFRKLCKCVLIFLFLNFCQSNIFVGAKNVIYCQSKIF